MFPNPWLDIKQFWRHQIYKLYQNTTSALVFMIVFGIHCNFFNVLPIWLKTYRSNGFFLFNKANCARPKNRARLRGSACPSAPNGHQASNLSRPDVVLYAYDYLSFFKADSPTKLAKVSRMGYGNLKNDHETTVHWYKTCDRHKTPISSTLLLNINPEATEEVIPTLS